MFLFIIYIKMDSRTLDELKKHIIQVNDILLKEAPKEIKVSPLEKVREVYRIDDA